MPNFLSKIKRMFGAEALENASGRAPAAQEQPTSDAVKRDTARRIREAQEMSRKRNAPKKDTPYRAIKPKHI